MKDDKQRSSIARIDLAMDNKELLDLLEERGTAINEKDIEKIREIEQKINDHKEE